MEKLPIGQAAKEVIEIPTSIAPPEPESGFPWCGTGIVVVVVAAGLLGRKFCACKTGGRKSCLDLKTKKKQRRQQR